MRRRIYFAFLFFSAFVFWKPLVSNPDDTKPYVKTQIVLTDGGTPVIRRSIQNALTKVIQEINRKAAGVGNLERIRQYCTEAGFSSIQKRVETDRIYCLLPEVKTNLLDILPSGYFEVRGIKVNLGRLSTEDDAFFEYLVFTLDSNGKITNLWYPIEQHQYEQIIQFGKKLSDESQRRRIVNFLKEYMRAYDRKNLPYLEKVFSDHALIIVGLVVQESNQSGDFLGEYSLLDPKEVRLIKRSKRQYLDSLRIKVFEKNSWIKVRFFNIEVIQHDSIPYIYGVTLKQDWKSQYYSDEGYLFLMFDFQNAQQPIIHVRSWQPRPFEDGSVVGLYDFRF